MIWRTNRTVEHVFLDLPHILVGMCTVQTIRVTISSLMANIYKSIFSSQLRKYHPMREKSNTKYRMLMKIHWIMQEKWSEKCLLHIYSSPHLASWISIFFLWILVDCWASASFLQLYRSFYSSGVDLHWKSGLCNVPATIVQWQYERTTIKRWITLWLLFMFKTRAAKQTYKSQHETGYTVI